MRFIYLPLLLVTVAPIAHAAAPNCQQREITALTQNNIALNLDIKRLNFNFNGDQFDPSNAPIITKAAADHSALVANTQKIADLKSGAVAPVCNKDGVAEDAPSCMTLANVAAWSVGRSLYAQFLSDSDGEHVGDAFTHSADFSGTTVGEWRSFVKNAYVDPLENHLIKPNPTPTAEAPAAESNVAGIAPQLPDATPLAQAFAGSCQN